MHSAGAPQEAFAMNTGIFMMLILANLGTNFPSRPMDLVPVSNWLVNPGPQTSATAFWDGKHTVYVTVTGYNYSPNDMIQILQGDDFSTNYAQNVTATTVCGWHNNSPFPGIARLAWGCEIGAFTITHHYPCKQAIQNGNGTEYVSVQVQDLTNGYVPPGFPRQFTPTCYHPRW
jgi:carbohydrate-selective porin OprB